MRALVVYCHPRPESFTATVRDVVLERLRNANAEVRLHDLYAQGFNPVLDAAEHRIYEHAPDNRALVQQECNDLIWADTLIFIYPTWWYGLPAMIKGWLDRAMVPEVAFLMPKAENDTIRPGLTHITRMGVFTTCGASRWLTYLVGAPGKRTLMRGLGFLLAPRARKVFAAHYLMDSSTQESRTAHLERVARKVDKLVTRKAPEPRRVLQEGTT